MGVEAADDGIETGCLFVRVVGAAPEGGHSAVGVEVAEEGAGGIFGGGDGNGRCLLRWLDELNRTAVVVEVVKDFVETAVGIAGEAGIGENIA